MKPPTPLAALRDELAREYAPGFDLIQKYFAEGFDAAVTALTEGVVFDEQAAFSGRLPGDSLSTFVAGARWQFDQMAARIGLAETRVREGKLLSDADNRRILELEARLAESEQAFDDMCETQHKTGLLLAAAEAIILRNMGATLDEVMSWEHE